VTGFTGDPQTLHTFAPSLTRLPHVLQNIDIPPTFICSDINSENCGKPTMASGGVDALLSVQVHDYTISAFG
jgi:hypothetical protein